MNCSLETKELAFYLDGILPPDEASNVEDHLASCSHCQARLDELKQVDLSLIELGVASRLREKTLKEAKSISIQSMLQSKSEPWFYFSPRQMASVMATFAIVIAAVFYFAAMGAGLETLIETGAVQLAYIGSKVQVNVGDDGYLRAQMADRGSIVEFAPQTKAVVLGPRSIQLEKGATWNQVAPDSEHPYTIHTPQGVVTVLGTEFEVEVGGETVVRVKKGSVRIALDESGTENVQIVNPGFCGRIQDRKVAAPQKIESDAIAAWRNQFIPNRELRPKNIADVLKGKP
jgi:ferric-dicitrate binding protein FerR (iron transport regulator)